MTSHRVDIGRKYDVDTAGVLPDLTKLPRVISVGEALASTLEAVYSDTDDLALAGAGITVRRRTGGSDAGWHVKLPRGGDDRSELAQPLSDDDDSIPAELLDHVRAWIRDRPVRRVATLTTRRVVHRLLGENGKVLAEVSDDVVTATATAEQGEVIAGSWREWEIELVDGSRKLLAAADELFTAAGATASEWPSKLHHALNRQPGLRPPATSELTGKSPAGAVLNAYLAEQVNTILTRDSGVRRSAPDAVHQARVATRRARSALSTFRPLVDRHVTDPIRDELKWWAGLLGGARDAEVQRAHLRQVVAAEPGDLVLGPVPARLEVELGSDYRTAHDALLAALDSARYYRLLAALEGLVAAPPFTDLAGDKARSVLTKRVSHVCKNLYALVSAEEPDAATETRDVRLHQIRKAAKRVRYAAEAAQPALGKSATALVAAATKVQETLGDHQDSVVARATLRAVAARMFLDGENAFTIGRLHALEQVRGAAAEAAFRKVWSAKVGEQLRHWIGK